MLCNSNNLKFKFYFLSVAGNTHPYIKNDCGGIIHISDMVYGIKMVLQSYCITMHDNMENTTSVWQYTTKYIMMAADSAVYLHTLSVPF